MENTQTRKVNLELEIDTNINNTGVNPYQKSIHLAKAVDAWRIFPRLFLSMYMFLLYYSTMWFMGLEEPSLEQSGLISIIVGAGAAGYFVYLTLNFILDGVLDDIKQQRMFAQALDNRVKTMNSELIRIDVKMCQAFNIRPDTDRIARADGKTDARRD